MQVNLTDGAFSPAPSPTLGSDIVLWLWNTMSWIMTGVAGKGGGRDNSRLPAWFLLHLATGEGVLLTVCAGIACCSTQKKGSTCVLDFFLPSLLPPPRPATHPRVIRIESTSGVSWFSGSTDTRRKQLGPLAAPLSWPLVAEEESLSVSKVHSCDRSLERTHRIDSETCNHFRRGEKPGQSYGTAAGPSGLAGGAVKCDIIFLFIYFFNKSSQLIATRQ